MKTIILSVLIAVVSSGANSEVLCSTKSQIFKYLSMWRHNGLGQNDSLEALASSYEKIPSETREQLVSEFYADPAILKLTNEEVEQQTNAICTGQQIGYLPPDPKIAAASKKYNYCFLRSLIYMETAGQRDFRGTPQESWAYFTKNAYWNNVPKEEIKSIINQVYFDIAFERAGGEALRNQMLDLCVNGPRKLKPLK